MDPPAGNKRVREQVTAWNTMIARGCDPVKVKRHMKIDVSQGNGLTLAEVDGLLSTPASFGGVGFEIGLPTIGLNSQVYEMDVKLNLSTIRGLDEEREYLAQYGMSVTDAEIIQLAKDTLEFTKVRGDLVGGELVHYSRVQRPLYTRIYNGFVAPLAGHSKIEKNAVLLNYALERMIKDKDWDAIDRNWLHPSLLGYSKTIRNRGGRRVWLAWLRGRLPFSLPIVEGWGEIGTTNMFQRLCMDAWQMVLKRSSFSMETVRRAAWGCEIQLREMLKSEKVRLGA
jgi:hypothetical protein